MTINRSGETSPWVEYDLPGGGCLAITTVVYLGLNRFTVLVMGGGLAATLGVYMGINFHHYVVDALIWKRRTGPANNLRPGSGGQEAGHHSPPAVAGA